MEFHVLDFSENDIETLGPELTALVSTSCYISNEIRVFQMLYLQSVAVEPKDSTLRDAANIHRMSILRVLAAKLFEAVNGIKNFEKRIIGSKSLICRDIFNYMVSELDEIKKLPGYEVAKSLRNKATNHYVPSEVLNRSNNRSSLILERTSFMNERLGNCFSPFGEQFVFGSILDTEAESRGISVAELIDNWQDWISASGMAITESHSNLMMRVVDEVLLEQMPSVRKVKKVGHFGVDVLEDPLPLFHI